MVFKFLACLSRKLNIKSLLVSLKTLTNSKDGFEGLITFSEQLLESQAAIGKPEPAS
jgi:hypothetical protein